MKMHTLAAVLGLAGLLGACRDYGPEENRDVPAGTYRLRAWHERVPGQTKEVVVPDDGEVRVDFELGPGNLPRY